MYHRVVCVILLLVGVVHIWREIDTHTVKLLGTEAVIILAVRVCDAYDIIYTVHIMNRSDVVIRRCLY